MSLLNFYALLPFMSAENKSTLRDCWTCEDCLYYLKPYTFILRRFKSDYIFFIFSDLSYSVFFLNPLSLDLSAIFRDCFCPSSSSGSSSSMRPMLSRKPSNYSIISDSFSFDYLSLSSVLSLSSYGLCPSDGSFSPDELYSGGLLASIIYI